MLIESSPRSECGTYIKGVGRCPLRFGYGSTLPREWSGAPVQLLPVVNKCFHIVLQRITGHSQQTSSALPLAPGPPQCCIDKNPFQLLGHFVQRLIIWE